MYFVNSLKRKKNLCLPTLKKIPKHVIFLHSIFIDYLFSIDYDKGSHWLMIDDFRLFLSLKISIDFYTFEFIEKKEEK